MLAASQLNRLDALAFAGGAGGGAALFLFEAVYALVAFVFGIRVGDRSGGGLDCGSRIARSAHSFC